MDVYSEKSYKTAIRNCVSHLQETNKSITLKKLSKRIRIQYTYLSKALNDPTTHLSQDRLFRICKALELGREETDFLMLLREFETADDAEWKEHLFNKIEETSKKRDLNLDVQQFKSGRVVSDMNYLFDPLATVVLASFGVPAIFKNPRLLCAPLGITPAHLRKILNGLSDVGHIELADDGVGVKKLKSSHILYGRDHPMMRTHQYLLKTLIQSQLMRIPEEQKHSYIATMTMDDKSYELIKAEFQQFLKRAEEICKKSKDEGTYQLNFDLFRWI